LETCNSSANRLLISPVYLCADFPDRAGPGGTREQAVNDVLRMREELQQAFEQAAGSARSIGVLLPCHNEEATISQVIEGFRHALPSADIYVYDNNSTDHTANSKSKLRTYRDGLRILAKIMMMYRALKPLQFYGAIALGLMALSVLLGIPVLIEYVHTGLVPRMPTALLAAAIMQLGFLSLACGIITEAIGANRRELKRMQYLQLSAPAQTRAPQQPDTSGETSENRRAG
jgi:hypothetical protein